ncbi:signal recognition particle-docking protein FtsY [Martelella sp. HB161492]|uniref:signal recognition particle-docking protein FtsY n=1 Tax=Martelella sp. HB161492 TaxID=2720726 RepID=UPI00159177B7|nr:signal recognition particle-docking protein FtsY [Martelella sp. HB161492]
MALGFLKNVFTFGKENKPQGSDDETSVAENAAEAKRKAQYDAASAFERDLLDDGSAKKERALPEDDVFVPAAQAQDEAPAPTIPDDAEPVTEPAPDHAAAPDLDADSIDTDIPDTIAAEQLHDDAPAADGDMGVTPAPRPVAEGFSFEEQSEPEALPAAPLVRLSWFERLRAGLSRTSHQLAGQIASLFTKRKLDEATLEELEDLLIQADLGVETAMRITDTLSSERYGKDVSGSDVARIMSGEIIKVLKPVARPLALDLKHKPHVILVVGVNGTGKTTTIGKLAAKLTQSGLKVTLGAGDTFRAAAIEQLKIWADRTGAEFVGTKLGADAAGLAYDAFEQAQANGSDVLIIDTAGRLQNKTELMAELEKIVRVLAKLDPEAPHTVLQTLDATTGQNAMNQVEIFRNVAGVSGLIMTKLDGTARGGILVAIAAKHKLPVYFIGVGEGIDDLEPFEAEEFAAAIAGSEAPE